MGAQLRVLNAVGVGNVHGFDAVAQRGDRLQGLGGGQQVRGQRIKELYALGAHGGFAHFFNTAVVTPKPAMYSLIGL